jgi:cystathionine beta-lyase family protein involved in aluminum resistance
MEFSERLINLGAEAEAALASHYARIDRISFENTARVLDAFREHRVSDTMFLPATGYGYGDRGRDTLDQIWADVFGTEAALVRHNLVSGTHALAVGLFGLLRPGDIMLSVTGRPYDTLDEVIGGRRGEGSLADFGIEYKQIELADGRVDYAALAGALKRLGDRVRVVYVQRSRGYSARRTLFAGEISELTDYVHRKLPGVYVVVDNCYGEFTEEREPRADLIIGSLIKNPGGGMAENGGYIAGSARAVELASYRLTTVGTGSCVGASLGQTKNMLKGLFYAPHTTAQALKTAHFAAYIFKSLGYRVDPYWDEVRSDIIQTVECGSPEALCAFCRGIQSASPIDSFVTPEPWKMPGYADPVIMAAGTFVQGASIELSADGPLRPPYTVYFQGGLTYESGKAGILSAAAALAGSCQNPPVND